MGEGKCPVDRVDDPSPAGLAGLLVLFLPEDPVAGVMKRELVADEALSLPVRLGHRRAVTLELNGERVRSEVAERELTGPAGQLDGLLQQLGEGIGRQLSQFREFVHKALPPAADGRAPRPASQEALKDQLGASILRR